MGYEIERKYLVSDTAVTNSVPGVHITQGYLPGELARIDVDGPRLELLHTHLAYPIPKADAQELAELLQRERLTLRVRDAAGEGFLTLKARGDGLSRPEFEYSIPAADVAALLPLCSLGVLRKVRHRIPFVGDRAFEVDVFGGALAGLVTAELELTHAAETFEAPPWLGTEVTFDSRYSNAQLARAQRAPLLP